jgi:hypothetical protein
MLKAGLGCFNSVPRPSVEVPCFRNAPIQSGRQRKVCSVPALAMLLNYPGKCGKTRPEVRKTALEAIGDIPFKRQGPNLPG